MRLPKTSGGIASTPGGSPMSHQKNHAFLPRRF